MVTKAIEEEIFGYSDFYKENVFAFMIDIINYEIDTFEEK